MYLLNIPNITDWLTAIAAVIGAPLALWGFIKLIKRDKERETEIAALRNLSSVQSQSLEETKSILLEFQKQTQEFEFQTSLMRESNEFFKEHLTIISGSFKNGAELKSNLANLEIRKRKSEIKPHFIFSGAFGQGISGEYRVRLKNIGQTAYLKDIVVPDSSELIFFNEFSENTRIDKDQEVSINGKIKDGSLRVNVADYEFHILFKDTDNNEYKQIIKRMDNGSRYKVDLPQEVL